MWSIYTMRYYCAFKRNASLIYDITWIKLENIILSEIKQTQNDKYYMTPLKLYT